MPAPYCAKNYWKSDMKSSDVLKGWLKLFYEPASPRMAMQHTYYEYWEELKQGDFLSQLEYFSQEDLSASEASNLNTLTRLCSI